MRKKVLMLQLVDKVDNNKSLDDHIQDLLSESQISGPAGITYYFEFDYYNPDIDIENIGEDSDEMTYAMMVGQLMVNSINSGELDYLLN